MSLPEFCTQQSLFGRATRLSELFAPDNRFRLFAEKIYPLLVGARPQLAACYCADNGRSAVEAVLVLGVSLLQFLENVPDRPALEQLQYHAGWNFALNRHVGDAVFDPSVLVRFRQRLLAHQQETLAFTAILEGLQAAGLVARGSRQRLDSTFVMGRLARMNSPECVRETLRLALEELAEGTGSELVQGHGARHARYRGLPKMRLQNYLIGGACNAKRSPPPPPMGTETSRTCGGICRHLARQWLNRGELSLGTGTTNQKGHESSEKVEQRKEPTQGKSARPPAFLPVLNRKPQNEGFAAESNAKM